MVSGVHRISDQRLLPVQPQNGQDRLESTMPSRCGHPGRSRCLVPVLHCLLSVRPNTGTRGEGTETGAGEGCSGALPSWTRWVEGFNSSSSQKLSASRIGRKRCEESSSLSTQTDKRNPRATGRVPGSRDGISEGTRDGGRGGPIVQMPINYSIMLSQAPTGMPESGQTSLSLSPHV